MSPEYLSPWSVNDPYAERAVGDFSPRMFKSNDAPVAIPAGDVEVPKVNNDGAPDFAEHQELIPPLESEDLPVTAEKEMKHPVPAEPLIAQSDLAPGAS